MPSTKGRRYAIIQMLINDCCSVSAALVILVLFDKVSSWPVLVVINEVIYGTISQ